MPRSPSRHGAPRPRRCARWPNLPVSTTARRDFTAVWAGYGTNPSQTLVHIAAKTATTLDYYLNTGAQWIGPINLTTFSANEGDFVVRDIGGCTGNAPILVGSVHDAASNKRKGLILAPNLRPF